MDNCGRCGLSHYCKVWCGARNSKCFKCHMYGHFARVCRTSIMCPTVNFLADRKKERDTERMTAFLRRKDMENLPFGNISTVDLCSLTFNSLEKLMKQRLKNQHIESRIVSNQQDESGKTDEMPSEELESLLVDTAETLHKHRDVLSAVESEFINVLSTGYKTKTAQKFENFECQKCGGKVFHQLSACPGNGNTCKICGNIGHLTLVCLQKCPHLGWTIQNLDGYIERHIAPYLLTVEECFAGLG